MSVVAPGAASPTRARGPTSSSSGTRAAAGARVRRELGVVDVARHDQRAAVGQQPGAAPVVGELEEALGRRGAPSWRGPDRRDDDRRPGPGGEARRWPPSQRNCASPNRPSAAVRPGGATVEQHRRRRPRAARPRPRPRRAGARRPAPRGGSRAGHSCARPWWPGRTCGRGCCQPQSRGRRRCRQGFSPKTRSAGRPRSWLGHDRARPELTRSRLSASPRRRAPVRCGTTPTAS